MCFMFCLRVLCPWLLLDSREDKQNCYAFVHCTDNEAVPSVTALTVLRRIFIFFVVHHFVVEPQKIDWDGEFSGVVLLCTRQEGLCEEEARKPEDGRRADFVPLLG